MNIMRRHCCRDAADVSGCQMEILLTESRVAVGQPHNAPCGLNTGSHTVMPPPRRTRVHIGVTTPRITRCKMDNFERRSGARSLAAPGVEIDRAVRDRDAKGRSNGSRH